MTSVLDAPSGRSRRPVRRWLAPLVAAVAVAGCSQPNDPAAQTSQAALVSTPSRQAAPPGWRRSTADKVVLDIAEDELAGRCMRDLGYRYWTAAAGGHPLPWDFPYVLDSPSWARAHGYGSADDRRSAEIERRNPNRLYYGSLSEGRQAAYTEALFGPRTGQLVADAPAGGRLTVSDRGCLARARTTLYGDLRTWFTADTVVTNLRPLVSRRISADPAYRQALGRWATCIRRAGYSAATPTDLQQRLAERVKDRTPEEADRIEREHAVAEATCAVATGLGIQARALDRRYQVAVEREYADAVRTVRDLQYSALLTARELAGQSAGADR